MPYLWLENNKSAYRVSESLRIKKKAERDANIAARYLAGEKITAIAGSLSLSRRQVSSILSKQKIEKRERDYKEKNTSRNLEIVRRYRQGETARSLAVAFDMTRVNVYSILRGKIKRMQAAMQCKDLLKRNMALYRKYKAGASAPALAAHFGLDRCHVLKIVRSIKLERKHDAK